MARTHRRQRDAGKQCRVRPALPRKAKACPAVEGGQQPSDTNKRKRKIREDVERVWHPDQRSLIGELVIGRILGDGRREKQRDKDGKERAREGEVANHASDSEILQRRLSRRATVTSKPFNTEEESEQRTILWRPAIRRAST